MASGLITKPLPYLALLFVHLIWGINFVVAKVTLQEFPPYSLAFFRFALASLFLAPFFWAETRKIQVNPKDLPTLVGAGILITTINIAFFFEGITRTTVINASVLTLIIPMISVLAGWWFLREKVYLINLAGITVGLIGALVIIGVPHLADGAIFSTQMLGNFLIILASISFVIGATLSRKMLNKYPSLTVTAIAFMVSTVVFFVPAALEYTQNPAWPNKISMLGILGLTFMVLLSSISAYFLFEWGLARVGVIKAELFQYLEPFVAAIAALVVLGEIITLPFIVGAILIAGGVYLGTLAKEAHHRHRKAHRI